MRKRSSKGGGAQRSIQVHLMVNEEEAAMIRAAARTSRPPSPRPWNTTLEPAMA